MVTTYFDGTGNCSNSLTYAGSATDNYSQGTTLTDQTVAQALYDQMGSGFPAADPTAIYMLLSSPDVTISGFCSSFCGWHSAFSVGSATLTYGFIGGAGQCLDSCSAVGGSSPTPNGDAQGDAMASILSHELAESTTDPYGNAWVDAAGNECADRCAWTFGTTYTAAAGSTANVQLGSREFLIQQDWVNWGAASGCAMSWGNAAATNAASSSATPSAAGTPAVTPSHSSASTWSPTSAATHSRTGSPVATGTPTPSPSPSTASASRSGSPSAASTTTATGTSTSTRGVSASVTGTAVASLSSTGSGTPSGTPSYTRPASSPTASATESPTQTLSGTATATRSVTPTASVGASPSGSASGSASATGSGSASGSPAPPAPLVISVSIQLGLIDASVLTADVLLDLRLGFACPLGVPVSQVLVNSTLDATTGLTQSYTISSPANALTGDCNSDAAAARMLLRDRGSITQAGQGGALLARRAGASGYWGVQAGLLILVPVPASPNGAGGSTLQAQRQAADSLYSTLSALVANSAGNSSSTLFLELAAFFDAAAAAMGGGTTASSLQAASAVNAPVYGGAPAPTPTPGGSGGGSGSPLMGTNEIIGVAAGGAALVLLIVGLSLFVVLQRRRTNGSHTPIGMGLSHQRDGRNSSSHARGPPLQVTVQDSAPAAAVMAPSPVRRPGSNSRGQ